MNKCIFAGNVASELKMRMTGGGTPVAEFRIAVRRRYANASGAHETDFFTVVAYNRLAKVCENYLQKGRRVSVVGSMQNRSYEAQDGSKRYVTELICEELEFQDNAKLGKAEPENDESAVNPSAPDDPAEFDGEELPF